LLHALAAKPENIGTAENGSLTKLIGLFDYGAKNEQRRSGLLLSDALKQR
jgi:hypothetical protein